MIISYNNILQYLPKKLSVEELSSILTSIGLEVEAVETVEAIKGGLNGLLIGEVLSCEKHPNADKLNLTKVDVGAAEPLHIVCGARNVAPGQKVVVAPVGTSVHPVSGESFEIKKAKIRGELSEGMICAEDEIGLGTSHEGIMVLPPDTPVGMEAKVFFGIGDADRAIYIGLTPNRSDAMSHIGVARDVCAYLSHHEGRLYEVQLPEVNWIEEVPVSAPVTVHVHPEVQEACPRYAGVYIADVVVTESPEWLKKVLQTLGIRSINNIVDITNFVLHEYGQPLHAFDADRIAGKRVEVRFLPEGTPFVGLDEKERKLYAEDLMICDAEKGMCIAGVFGGAYSGVTGTTKNIFLESAFFNAGFIRRSSLRHALRTDAATHFEKVVDMQQVIPALKRAATLIVEIAGGHIVGSIQDVYPQPLPVRRIKASYEYFSRLSGKIYTPEVVKGILSALQFRVVQSDDSVLEVEVPSNKNDVHLPADLVEEILRIDGLDKIEIPKRLNISLLPALPNDRSFREKVAQLLCGMGFQEIVTNSITNSRYYPDNNSLVRMINSLTSELDVLRPDMLESGLEVMQYNLNRKNTDLTLFEFGNTYASVAEGQYGEQPILALWLCGQVRQASWNQTAYPVDLFYIKGVLENLCRICGIDKTTSSLDEQGDWICNWKNRLLFRASKVKMEKLKHFDIRQDVYYVAVQWSLWIEAMQDNKIRYKEVPKFPYVQRDLALVLDKSVTYEEVQKVTRQAQVPILKHFDLFDVFESEKLGPGKKSYAMNFTFQVNDRTLTDVEIETCMQQLMQAYQNKLQAQIRS